MKYIHMVIQPSPPSISRTSTSFQTEAPLHCTVTLHFPLPQAVGVTISLCVCEFGYSSTLGRWNHRVFVLLCPAYATQLNVFKVHPCCSMCVECCSFSRLTNIPLNIHTYHFLKNSPVLNLKIQLVLLIHSGHGN